MSESATGPAATNAEVVASAAEPAQGKKEIPTPPQRILDAGPLAPDHWLGIVDPNWSGDGPPPHWAVIGRWRTDGNGEIVDWEDNEEYRPSPEALDWPEPTDAVDAALQRAATGYGPDEDVTRALADAEVVVFVQPSGEPVVTEAPDGEPAVPVFTMSPHLDEVELDPHELTPVRELITRLPDDQRLLYLSPSAPACMVIDVADLLTLLP